MDARKTNEIILHLRRYCPTMQRVSDPTTMDILKVSGFIYYIFSYDPFNMKIDAVIYEEYDGDCYRDTVYLSELYDYDPSTLEHDEAIGLKQSELYRLFGKVKVI